MHLIGITVLMDTGHKLSLNAKLYLPFLRGTFSQDKQGV